MQAAKALLDRLVPVVKDRPVSAIVLPELRSAHDAAAAMSIVLAAVSDGELTPAEGEKLAGLVEAYRRTLETSELERRLAEIEDRLNAAKS